MKAQWTSAGVTMKCFELVQSGVHMRGCELTQATRSSRRIRPWEQGPSHYLLSHNRTVTWWLPPPNNRKSPPCEWSGRAHISASWNSLALWSVWLSFITNFNYLERKKHFPSLQLEMSHQRNVETMETRFDWQPGLCFYHFCCSAALFGQRSLGFSDSLMGNDIILIILSPQGQK